MNIQKTTLEDAYAVKITAEEEGKEVGRVYVYMLFNDLHSKPFGLVEDMYVDEGYRGHGLGSELLTEAVSVAKEHGCYKLLCTSRHERMHLHEWYEKHGFKNYGIEFRMELDSE